MKNSLLLYNAHGRIRQELVKVCTVKVFGHIYKNVTQQTYWQHLRKVCSYENNARLLSSFSQTTAGCAYGSVKGYPLLSKCFFSEPFLDVLFFGSRCTRVKVVRYSQKQRKNKRHVTQRENRSAMSNIAFLSTLIQWRPLTICNILWLIIWNKAFVWYW